MSQAYHRVKKIRVIYTEYSFDYGLISLGFPDTVRDILHSDSHAYQTSLAYVATKNRSSDICVDTYSLHFAFSH